MSFWKNGPGLLCAALFVLGALSPIRAQDDTGDGGGAYGPARFSSGTLLLQIGGTFGNTVDSQQEITVPPGQDSSPGIEHEDDSRGERQADAPGPAQILDTPPSVVHTVAAAKQVCGPLPDFSACNQVSCSVAGQICRPTVIRSLPGVLPQVLACDCLADTDCHVEFDAANQPFCAGSCPPGKTCELFGTDTDGDGVDDEFRCDCVCDPCVAPFCCDNPLASSFAGGVMDNFAPPPDPASPTPALTTSIIGRDFLGRPPMDFDEIPGETIGLDGQPTDGNRYFGHSFTGLPTNIVSATLEIRLRLTTIGAIGPTDSLSLWLDTGTDTFAWSRRIQALTGGPGTWTLGGSTATLVLDLAALPLAGGGTRCILPQINSNQTLDIMVQDDTGVDYAILTVHACPCTPPPANMTAWWPLDEPIGPTANDFAGVVNNAGTHIGAPVPVPGKVAGALSFNGTTAFVQVPDHAELDLGTADFTIDAWVKCPTGTTGVSTLVEKRDGLLQISGYTLFLVNGLLTFQMADASAGTCGCTNNPLVSACTTYISPATSPNVCNGQWNHVAVSVVRASTTGGVMYVNGAVVHTFDPTIRSLSLDNNTALWLGRHRGNPCSPASTFFAGQLDEVEIFKRALTDVEIRAIFNAGGSGKCKDCQPLADGSACMNTLCPDPNKVCQPRCMNIDAMGVVTVVDCDCTGATQCHVELDPVGLVSCVGTCLPGEVCKETRTVNPDGSEDVCCSCEPAVCEPTPDQTGCQPVVCPETGCFGECINGSYCDDPQCCIDPNACQCYAPNSKESIKRCGDCFGECVGGSYCDDPNNPACCIGGACACYSPNSDISLQLCGDCFGECINGAYCDGADPSCCIVPGSCACYLPDSPISLKLCANTPVTSLDTCQPQCVNFDPATGATKVKACDCVGKNKCHVKLPGSGSLPAPLRSRLGSLRAAAGGPCIVPNVAGTVTLPPVGCPYLSPEAFHEIVDGLPLGTKIEIGVEHLQFMIRSSGPGGSLGGEVETFDSTLQLNMKGNAAGSLAGFMRSISVPMSCEAHIGPRTPGDAVQDFDTDMFRCQGEILPGDPDFDMLRIVAGTDNGLPSPGHTTLTRQGGPGSPFAVDSFFDMGYRIEFVGKAGSPLSGMMGTTDGQVRMQTGTAPSCVGTCLPGEVCVETRTPQADGSFDLCCTCEPKPHENWVIADDFCITCDCQCDVNGDGQCNFADVVFAVNCFQTFGAPGCDVADVNCDGVVKFDDIQTLVCFIQGGNADSCCPASTRKGIDRVQWFGSYLDLDFEPPLGGGVPLRDVDSWLVAVHRDVPAVACPAVPPGKTPVDLCGTLKAGVEVGCILFTPKGSSSDYLILNNAALVPFVVGDMLRICGWIEPNPITTCQQGIGGIQVQSVSNCGTGVSRPGRLVAQWAIPPSAVRVEPTGKVGWDNHRIFRYTADLKDGCLLHDFSRKGELDAATGVLFPRPRATYWISFQAAVGHAIDPNQGICADSSPCLLGTVCPDGTLCNPAPGGCAEIPTGNTVTRDFWGWHTTPPGYQRKDDAFMGQLKMGCNDEWIYDWMGHLHCSDPRFKDCCDDPTKSIDMAFYLIHTGKVCASNLQPCTTVADCPAAPDLCQPDGTETVRWCQPINPGPPSPTDPVPPPRPLPKGGLDEFPLTDLFIQVNIPAVSATPITLNLQGPTVVGRSIPENLTDHRRRIQTEILSMELRGTDPLLGDVTLRAGSRLGLPPSTGESVMGVDPTPFVPFDSFFDVTVRIVVGGQGAPTTLTAVSEGPVHLTAQIFEIPPSQTSYRSTQPVNLINPATGALIGTIKTVDHFLPFKGGVDIHSDVDWANTPREPCCQPDPTTATGCSDTICPDPNERCIPVDYFCDAAGLCVPVGCDCRRDTECHAVFDPIALSVTCVGTCPMGLTCTPTTRDVDGDGVDDLFSCGCDPVVTEACCKPDGTCADLPRDECCALGGIPEGTGTDCATNANDCPNPPPVLPQACCLGSGGCQNLLPQECLCQDGVPQGPGTSCQMDANGNGIDDACERPCQPTADGSACEQVLCPDLGVNDRCQPRCVDFDPTTGVTTIKACDCRGMDECHVDVPGILPVLPSCIGTCPPGEVCAETRTVDPVTGVITICCDCGCPATVPPKSPTLLSHAGQNKVRYLSFVPNNPGQITALKVTLVSSATFPAAVGSHWWVGPPTEICENGGQSHGPPGCGPAPVIPKVTMLSTQLQCSRECRDWGSIGDVIHVGDPGIASDGVYEIRAIDCSCDPTVATNFSAPLPVPTSVWSDLVNNCASLCAFGSPPKCGPPNGTIDLIFDCVAIANKFSNLSCAPIKSRTDIAPASPDRVIDILDIVACVQAFKGASYPYPAPVSCP